MNTVKYEEKIVKIVDALVEQSLGDDDNPAFTQKLHLTLKDINTEMVFRVSLSENEVRRIINFPDVLNSKQMIDLSLMLREREDPIKLLIPENATEIVGNDIMRGNSSGKKNSRRRSKYRKNNKQNKQKTTQQG